MASAATLREPPAAEARVGAGATDHAVAEFHQVGVEGPLALAASGLLNGWMDFWIVGWMVQIPAVREWVLRGRRSRATETVAVP